jgi:hypothetical protein
MEEDDDDLGETCIPHREIRNGYKILVGNSELNRSLATHRSRWQENKLKLILKK